MQNFKSSTAMVIELHFFMKKMKMKSVYFVPHACDIFVFFCMQLLFVMFSTLMSLEVSLKSENCIAIMPDHPWQSALPYTV